jgi:pyruvate dehydrogenase E1 component
VALVGIGVVMPELSKASEQLSAQGVANDVVCLTSADLVFRALQARRGLQPGDDSILDALLPADRACPIVAVIDGHPHALAFLGGIRGVPIACLGVHDFGQTGDVADLYRHFGIDAETIVATALEILERP